MNVYIIVIIFIILFVTLFWTTTSKTPYQFAAKGPQYAGVQKALKNIKKK